MVAKKDLGEDRCVVGIKYEPGETGEKLDGYFHVITLVCENGYDEREECNLENENWFFLSLNSTCVTKEDAFIDKNFGEYNVFGLKQKIKEDGLLDLVESLNFKIVNQHEDIFYDNSPETCLKLFFGEDLCPANTVFSFMSYEEALAFFDKACSMLENWNKNKK